MDWYYSLNNEQKGPISEEQLQDLFRQGAVGNSSLVWKQGMANWQPYGSMKGTGLPDGKANCASCGKMFSTADMVQYQGLWICADCKPAFLQRLQEGLNPTGNMLWRSGKQLVMLKGATLPERCVKCNAPAPGPGLKRNLAWHQPAIYLLILLSLLIYIIVAVIVQKRAKIVVNLCEAHRAKRRFVIRLASGIFVLAVLMLIGSGIGGILWLTFLGIVTFIGALLYRALGMRMVYARRIDDKYIWLGGVGREFLDTLPEWVGK